MVLNKVGLTGSSGMLGRHLRAEIEKMGVSVIAVNRIDLNAKNSKTWDLTNWCSFEKLDEVFLDAQVIIHAGAMTKSLGTIDDGSMYNANVRACLNLGEWAISRDIPIIYVSGAVVYANANALNQKEDAQLGWNGLGGFYGFSKLLAEDTFMRLQQKGLKLSIIRPSSIYGFGMTAEKMIRRFLILAEKNEIIELKQPIEDQVDLVHASDVSSAIVALLQKDATGIFNISSGKPISMIDLAKSCVKLLGRGDVVVKGEVPKGFKPTVRFSLNTDKARHQLNWQPKIDILHGLNMVLKETTVSPIFYKN